MCGICGFVDSASPEVLDRMTQVIAHRGPDDSGTYLSEAGRDGVRAGLGSRRLAILDLSPCGRMPMVTPDGRFWITYNGEIYNFPELRRELEQRGCQFRSRSDTEVILHLYALDGAAAVRRLNGMFAFAIWDNRERTLFLARDHFGIKPLYYAQHGASLAFGSEIKSLLEWPHASRSMDPEALNQYLTFLWVPDPLTMFSGVRKLEAGHHAVFQDGVLRQTCYWSPSFPPAEHGFGRSEADLIHELRDRFRASVKSQLLSDVPVGAFLSAGLDSTSIVASMAAESTAPVRTFTITYPHRHRHGEGILDDPAVARRTAASVGAVHREIVVEPDVVGLLPRLTWHMDEPIADPAIIAAYLVAREARSDVTVLLSGVGGDELFAGYRKHRAHDLALGYQQIPAWLRTGLIEPLVSALPTFRGTRIKGFMRLAKKMARSGSLPPIERFLTDSTYLSAAEKRALLSDGSIADATDPWGRHRQHFSGVANADWLNQMLCVDQKTFMVSLNLTYNDKMSMASSVETRVPFLDWTLADWVATNVPPGLKLRGATTKHILREAMRPLVPAEVLAQPKAGFGAPTDYWLTNDLREMVDDVLSEQRVRARGLFQPVVVRRMIAEQRAGTRDWSLQLWQLLTLELWQQAFLDKGAA